MLFCPKCEHETLSLWTDSDAKWVGACVFCGQRWRQDDGPPIELMPLDDYSSVLFDDGYDSSADDYDDLEWTTELYDRGFEDGYGRAIEDAEIGRRLRRWWIAHTWRHKRAFRAMRRRFWALLGRPETSTDDIPF